MRTPRAARKPSRLPHNGNGTLRLTRAIYVKTQWQLAALFGVATVSIGDWRKDGAPPKEKQGWPLAAWIAWRVEQVRKHAVQNASATSDHDRAFKIARARLAELRLKREAGELAPVKD